MSLLSSIVCELVFGHRFGPWVAFIDPDVPLLRYERAQCRWCRTGFVRPRRRPLSRLEQEQAR